MTDMSTSTETSFDPAEEIAKVTVWSKPGCVQCNATKQDLDRKGIRFEEESLVENPDQLALFVAAGHKSAPIVVFQDMVWTGFRPDMHAQVQSRLHH